ncbi:hypothetical protein INT45_007650 [Circinella minor]|uniref:HTH APSES-type domain-containing protein n=1 Tax=Circinella minor TaxID=1195481 RepID=A0A8H7RYP2_9FUNG|nr:hypothetical protein INT45_007650 [Circinella minor]
MSDKPALRSSSRHEQHQQQRQQQQQGDASSSKPTHTRQQKGGLPVPIHPDDAKDKVFTAILKALLKMGNKPSSPKELANVIVKYKYATLGGATPFATVSSRISQHFKRAAEHNPPRPPLLAKHFDENHSRKINYSLATEPSSSSSSSSSSTTTTTAATNNTTITSHEPLSPPPSQPTSQQQQQQQSPIRQSKRHRKQSSISQKQKQEELSELSSEEEDSSQRRRKTKDEEESEAEYSDYHEEMLKGDDVLGDMDSQQQQRRRSSISISSRRPSIAQAMTSTNNTNNQNDRTTMESPRLSARRQSFSLMGDDMWNVNNNNNNQYDQQDFDPVFLDPSTAHHQLPFNIATPESVSVQELEAYFNGDSNNNNNNNNNSNNGNHNNNNNQNGASSSTSSAPFSSSSSFSDSLQQLPTHIPSAARTTSRKSFSAMMGCRETSLLQRALLASTARGLAEQNNHYHHLSNRQLQEQEQQHRMSAIETSSVVTTGDLEELDEQEEIVTRPRRKSWPDESTTSGANLLLEDDDEDNTELDDSTMTKTIEKSISPSLVEEEKDDEKTATTTTKENGQLDQQKEKKEKEEMEEEEDENDTMKPRYQRTLNQRQKYSIIKKTFGPLECYQLDSPEDIPDTKVLRFIASTDGATEHVALRTRHAADTSKDRRNSQHFYLDQGYVNATQLRKAARPVLGKGPFDAATETEEGRVVVTLTKGPLECRGAWVPLSRARELIEEFEIESSPGLTKLLSDEPLDDDDDKGGEEEGNEQQQQLKGDEKNLNINGTQDGTDDQNTNNNDTKQVDPHVPDNKNTQTQSKSPPLQQAPKQIQQQTLLDVDDDESFVQFEDDEEITPTSTVLNNNKKPMETSGFNGTSISPQQQQQVTKIGDNKDIPQQPQQPSPLDLLKTLSIPNLNIAALQQMTAAIPGLAHLSSTFDLAKTLATYMQSVNKSSSSPSSLSPNFASDFKTALARFPALENLFRKDSLPSSSSSTSPTPSNTINTSIQPQHPSFVHITDPQQQIVHTTMSTNPPMYITIVDNIPVCIAVLAPTDTVPQECRIMRRLDSGYINGTKLLTAGGIDTESERSMILSFEMERRRMPRKKSELYGTWIPLRRAQELAVTCSIQHRLGPFLSDKIESYFPSPLPIQVPMLSAPPGGHHHRRTTSTPPFVSSSTSSGSISNNTTSPNTTTTTAKDHRLTAFTLQALRNQSSSLGISSSVVGANSGIPSPSSSNALTITNRTAEGVNTNNTTNNNNKGYGLLPPTQTTSAAQLHQLILGNNPRKFAELAQKAPLLGTFEGDDEEDDEEDQNYNAEDFSDEELENKQPAPIIDSSNAKPVIITAGGRKTILGGPLNNKRKRKQVSKPKLKKKKKKKEEKEDDESSDVDIVNSESSLSSSSSSSEEEEEEEEEEEQVQIIEEQIKPLDVGEEEDADTDTDTDVEEVRQRMKRMRDAAIEAMESGSSFDLEELLRRASSPIMENPRRIPLSTTTTTTTTASPINTTTAAATALPGNRIPSVSTAVSNNNNNISFSSSSPSLSPSSSSTSIRRNGKATARRRPQGPGRSVGGKIAPSALKKSASWSGTLTSPLRVVVPTKKLQNKKHGSTTTRPSKLRQNTAADELLMNRVVEHTPSTSTTTIGTSSSSPAMSSLPTVTTTNSNNNNNNNVTTNITTPSITSTVTPSTSAITTQVSPLTSSKSTSTPTTTSGTDVLATIQEDDEDEEIDIGGSEEDDDLR